VRVTKHYSKEESVRRVTVLRDYINRTYGIHTELHERISFIIQKEEETLDDH